MHKKKLIIGIAIFVLLVGAALVFKAYAVSNNEQAGHEKFNKAISELRAEKQYDNPCLGTSVLRKYSYAELNNKTIEEIKELAKIDPWAC